MKINEIAIKEAPPFNKYDTILGTGKTAGKALPRVQRLPGETMKDAISRAKSELGGLKAAGPGFEDDLARAGLISPKPGIDDGPFGPAVWRRPGDPKFDTTLSTASVPSTSDTIPKPIVPAPKPRANTSAYDREVLNRHDLNPGMPNKGKPSSDAEKYLELKQAQAARTAAEKQAAADDLARQVSPADDLSKEIKPGEIDSRAPSIDSELPPMIAEPRPISPGAGTTNTTGGRQEPGMGSPTAASDTVTMPRDFADRLLSLAERNPAAAKAAAEKAGIPWGKIVGYPTAALATTVGAGTAWDAMTPDYVPKVPPILNAKNWVPTITPTKNTGSKETEPENSPPVVAPTADQIRDLETNDPAFQAAQENLRRAIRDAQSTNESTSELNRLVYLSRL